MANFFATPLVLGTLCFAGIAAQSAFAREVTLEDHSLLVAFDSHTGALTRLVDKTTHWTIERRSKLGVAFRLFAPLPKRNWNPVYVANNKFDYPLFRTSPKQKPHMADVKKISNQEIRLQWKNPISEDGVVLPMTLTSFVTLTNGVLTFNATLKNDSSLTVDTIDYPYLGDLNPPTRHTSLAIRLMRHNNPNDISRTGIYPFFGNEHGYWGVFYPLKFREADESLFCLIESPDEGLYVEMDVPKAPYRMQYTFELRPGVISSINNRVPEEDEISGHPVHLEFRTCHFIWLKPHSTIKLAPIVMRCYSGNWHTGVDLYKHWRATLAQ